jgi:hypothetical protein
MMDASDTAFGMAEQTAGAERLKGEILSLSASGKQLARERSSLDKLERRFEAAAAVFDRAKPGSDFQLERLAELEELEALVAQAEQRLLAALTGTVSMLTHSAPDHERSSSSTRTPGNKYKNRT